MRPPSQLLAALRRKGLFPALAAGFGHLLGRLREYRQRRWYRLAHESNRNFDLRYGVDTFPLVEVADLDVDAAKKSESNRFQSIHEKLFSDALGHVKIDHSIYSFVDFGSGKGKAMLLASLYPFRKIVGVEFSNALCQICRRNLELFSRPDQKTRAFEVRCIDARQYQLVSEPTVFFFFNPFQATLMQSVVDRIASSIRSSPHPVWIVYCNPDFASCIDASPMFESVAAAPHFRVWCADRQQ